MRFLRNLFLAMFWLTPAFALAALPAVNPTVRYMSLGDSLAAGYKAQPATQGYAYQLYLDRVFGSIPDTVFDNAAVPGAKSSDVLEHQIPQVQLFKPTVVTMSVGGNDLLTLLGSTPPSDEQVYTVLKQFGDNLLGILTQLCMGLPEGGAIYLHNLYTIPEIPGVDQIVPFFNSTMAQVVSNVKQLDQCLDKTIGLADVYSAFLGQNNLLLIERYLKKGIETAEVHPTDKGHHVIEDAFRAVITP
jgi:lysophospholipase L1-like esterase